MPAKKHAFDVLALSKAQQPHGAAHGARQSECLPAHCLRRFEHQSDFVASIVSIMASQFMEQKGNKACVLAPKKVTLDFGAVVSLGFAGLWRQIKKTHSLCASLRLQSVAGKLQLGGQQA